MENIKPKNQELFGGRRVRSYFWPLLLIGVGVVWLLNNFGILTGANIVALLQLWPLLLIVGGFELLFGRTQPQLARVLGIGTLAFALAFMVVGPVFGVGRIEVKTEQFTEPLGATATANIRLSPGVAKTTITAASSDSSNLLDANVTHIDTVTLSRNGDKDKEITLQQESPRTWNWGFVSQNFADAKLRWDVMLNPKVPINLTVDNGVGESNLDLSKLNLTGADITAGVGQVTVNLPASATGYNASIDAGVGAIKATLPAESSINLKVSGGTGNVDITVPEGAAVQVLVDSGLGRANFANNLNFAHTVNRGNDKNGTYETPNFASASHKIVIDYHGGVGNFSIHN